MTSFRAAAYLLDAQQAAQAILRFTVGRTEADYTTDMLLRSAVERQFIIIGEALISLRRVAPELAAKVPDLVRIIGLRHRLTHGYGDIDDAAVWLTAAQDLRPLADLLLQLYDDVPKP